jgi:hypothetical protein
MKARLDRITNPQLEPVSAVRSSQIRARSSVRTASEARMSLVEKKAQSAIKHYPKPRGLIPK